MHILSFYILTDISIPFLIIALISVIAGVIFYYRLTLPPISRVKKIFLMVLRTLSVFFILMTLFSLVAGFSRTNTIPEKTVFLIDDSKSIKAGLDTSRYSTLKSLLSEINKITKNNSRFLAYTFSEVISDTLDISDFNSSFNGFSTNISSPLNSIKERNESGETGSIVLISDGIYNSGEKPTYAAERGNIPVFTIGVGDARPKKDVVLENLITNDLLYLNTGTIVKVEIKNNGYRGEKTEVSLFENNELIGKQEIILSENINEIDFEYKPRITGDVKLTAIVKSLAGEFIDKNNQMIKYVRVLDNKIKILVVASAPGSDFAFILNSLKQNPDFAVNGLLEKGNNEFYPQYNDKKKIDSADVLFLIGYPAANSSPEVLNSLVKKISEKNLPLFVLVNGNTDFNKLNSIKEFLPFETGKNYGDFTQVNIDVVDDAKNEIMDLNVPNSEEVWNSFPPVYKIDREFIAKPGSDVLANFRIQNNKINLPLILKRNINKQKSIAFLASEIWRLKLLNAIRADENSYFDIFISNSAKWLHTRENKNQFEVKPLKKVFDNSEKIILLGQLYDESNNPVSNAEINISIKKQKGDSVNLALEPLGNGLYRAELDNTGKGDYSFYAQTEQGKQKLTAKGGFTVTETELEFKNLTMDEELLKQISALTGGKYFTLENAQEFLNNINKYIPERSIEKTESEEYRLWNSAIFMLIIILLLSLEWFFRKRYNLI